MLKLFKYWEQLPYPLLQLKVNPLEGNVIIQTKFTTILFVLLLFITGCSIQPAIDMNKVITQSEKWLKGFDEIDTTTASYDGKRDIKFRLMVNEIRDEEEAEILFQKILDSIGKFSNSPETWNYYNGYFDIKSYDDGVIYEATKLIGEDLEIIQIKEKDLP